MTPKDLQELVAVADARRQQAEAQMSEICKRERHLRGLLQDLADQFQAGVEDASGGGSIMHGLGAYQAWVDFARRQRATLNQDLARVLAEKAECRKKLQRQFGQQGALQALQSHAEKARRKSLHEKDQDKILATHAILRGLPGSTV